MVGLRPITIALVPIGLLAVAAVSIQGWTEAGDGHTRIEFRPADLGRHPNLFIDAAEIRAVQSIIAQGHEPWASAYAEMIAAADDALTTEPVTVVGNGRPPDSGDPHAYATDRPYTGTGDGIINPLNDRTDYRHAITFSHAVRDLGLGYAFTGDERYARAALRLVEAWMTDPASRMTPKFTNKQSRIELSITMPAAFYGIDLIWHAEGWSAETRRAVLAWVRRLGVDATSWKGESSANFENWRIVLTASAAALSGDAELLARSFAEWQQLIQTQMDGEGKLIFELGRTRSLSYSAYAIKAMALGAEIGRHYGVDLYGYVLEDGRGLELAFDFHAPYVLDPARWPWQQITDFTSSEASVYELAYAFRQKPSYFAVIEAHRRSLTENRVLGPITLTHAHGAYAF